MSVFAGQAASLGAALTWAGSTAVYERHGQLSVADLSFLRTSISTVAFLCLMPLCGGQWPGLTPSALIALSGLLTFGLADALFFVALGRLGGQATSIPQCAVPVVVTVLAWLTWREALTVLQVFGLAVTLGAVGSSMFRREPSCPGGMSAPARPERGRVVGAACAGLSALLQALGVLILKKALAGVDVVAAMTLRIGPTAVVMTIWRLSNPRRRCLPTGQQRRWLVAAILLGTVGGTLLQSYGLQHAPAGICTVLNATYPLWLIPINFFVNRQLERASIPAALAALMGVGIVCA